MRSEELLERVERTLRLTFESRPHDRHAIRGTPRLAICVKQVHHGDASTSAPRGVLGSDGVLHLPQLEMLCQHCHSLIGSKCLYERVLQGRRSLSRQRHARSWRGGSAVICQVCVCFVCHQSTIASSSDVRRLLALVTPVLHVRHRAGHPCYSDCNGPFT